MRERWLILLAGAMSLGFQSGGHLSGFRAEFRTVVYEDLSVSRQATVVWDGEQREAFKIKRDVFRKNGYELIEKNENGKLMLLASKVFPTSGNRIEKFQDDLARIAIERKGYAFFYNEDFSTGFLMNDVRKSDLKDDPAAARMLLADVKFEFTTVLPGKVDSMSFGEFRKDTARWSYDVDQIFRQESFQMRVASSSDRGDLQIWLVALIGGLLALMGYLFRLKNKLRRA